MLRRSRFFACTTTPSHQQQPHRRLCFNPFTGRMTPNTAAIFQELACVGIAESPDHKGMLAVVDSASLNHFAQRVRADPENNIPTAWSRRMRNTISGMLRSLADGDDATDIMNAFFKRSALDKMYQRDVAGAIGTVSTGDGGAGDVAAENEEFFGTSGVFERPSLSDEQQKIVDYACKGFNMFICGDAGTGKTVTLKELVYQLRQRRLVVAVTASTGLAACHLGGTTFHSFSGIGKKNDFLQCTKAMPIADVIVIDEISMLSGSLIENLDHFLRGERNNNAPFGGTQIIICGDFLQLSFIPLSKYDTANVFELDVFKNHFLFCKLIKQVRQAGNERFAEQLRELRVGQIPSDLFNETSGILKIDDPEAHPVDDETIRLLPRNEQVTNANRSRLEKLPGDVVTFVPSATPPTLEGDWTSSVVLEVKPHEFNLAGFKQNLHKYFLDNMPMEMHHYMPPSSIVAYFAHEDGIVVRVMKPVQKPEIAAKVAYVWEKAIGRMPFFTIDMEATTLVEPSAKVIDVLASGLGLHTPQIEDRLNAVMKEHPVAQALPLKIGAPVLLRVNLSNRLVNGSVGQVVDYVPATPEKLPNFLLRSPRLARALEQYTSHSRFALGNDDPMVPLVRFRGNEKQDVPIPPVPFTVGGDVGTNYYSIDAISIPLTLAFAFTVHKVQGLTLLSKVRLELENMWNCEHIVYVAMSRVKKPEQLSISGWKDDLVVCNKSAVAFDGNVPPVSEVEERLLKMKNRDLTQFSRENYCYLETITDLNREATMTRATWWRLENRDFRTGRSDLLESGKSAAAVAAATENSISEDGKSMISGSSAGTMINAKQANRAFKSASQKNFSFSNKSKKRPSLLGGMKPTTASNVQHRTSTTTTTMNSEQVSSTSEEQQQKQEQEFKLPPKMFTSSSSSTTTTKNEDQLKFGMEPKSSNKKKQSSTSSQQQKRSNFSK